MLVVTHGDLAMNSCAQFLAVAEHRLIPARVRSVGHQLRQADFLSVCGYLLARITFQVVVLGWVW